MLQVLQVEAGLAHRPSAKGIRLIINSTRMIIATIFTTSIVLVQWLVISLLEELMVTISQ